MNGGEFHDHRRPLHPKINCFTERVSGEANGEREREIIWNNDSFSSIKKD